MPDCLVLGATGFIGGHIAKAARSRGWRTRALRRDPQAIGHLAGEAVEWVTGDLNNLASLEAAMRGMEVVFHAAAYYPKGGGPRDVPAQVADARQEIETVVKAARKMGVKRFVFTSSLTTIGHPPAGEKRLADERDMYLPGLIAKSGYYESKCVMEAYLLEAARDGFPAVILNPTAVFGPGDVHLTMARALLALKRGWGIAWLPVTVNVVDVRDVAEANIVAAEKGRVGQRYILGGYNLSMRAAIEMVANIAGVRLPRFEIPLRMIDWIVSLGDALPFLSSGNHLRAVRHWQGYNTEKARREFAIIPRPFEDTIRDALDWLEEWERNLVR